MKILKGKISTSRFRKYSMTFTGFGRKAEVKGSAFVARHRGFEDTTVSQAFLSFLFCCALAFNKSVFWDLPSCPGDLFTNIPHLCASAAIHRLPRGHKWTVDAVTLTGCVCLVVSCLPAPVSLGLCGWGLMGFTSSSPSLHPSFVGHSCGTCLCASTVTSGLG